MKNDRLFRLLYILLQRHNATAPQLAALMEVSVRTVYRDIEALCAAGIPICTVSGRGGGISLMPGYTFDRALLSDEEQNHVLYAIQGLQATGHDVEPLLSKLGTVFQKARADWIEVDFSRWGFGRQDNEKFRLLREAILQRELLRIRYCGSNGRESQREIQPLKLVFKDKNWYLQALCRKAGDFRLFKLSRILSITPTGQRCQETVFEIPPVESESPPPHAPVCLKLLFSSSMAFRVYDEFDRQQIEPLPDGSLLVCVSFPLDAWVCGYLLSFGDGLTILEPAFLREQTARYAEKIAEHHKADIQLSGFACYTGDIQGETPLKNELEECKMEQKFCQCCGMPMGAADEGYGTEADGGKSRDYCAYCYQDGAFTFHGTLDEMVEICVPPMVQANPGMTEESARGMMKQFLPTLKRWKA